MTIPGPSKRFVHLYDSGGLGLNLTEVNGRTGAFNPPAINQTLHDLTGSASENPAIERVGHETADDWSTDIAADSDIQSFIDRWCGVTPAHRDTAKLLCVGWTHGSATGGVFQAGRVYQNKVLEKTTPALLTTLNLLVKFTGRVMHMVTLHGLSEEVGDGDTEADDVDNGASSADGGTALLGWTALDLDGGDDLSIDVIDSPDGITYGVLASFTPITAAGGFELVEVAGTVERHLAVQYAYSGTPGGNEAATFEVGFERN